MKAATKKYLLDIAEVLDAHRIIPKLLMIGYGWMCYDVYNWATDNPEIAAAKWIFTAVFGVAGIVTGAYFNSGRKWENQNNK